MQQVVLMLNEREIVAYVEDVDSSRAMISNLYTSYLLLLGIVIICDVDVDVVVSTPNDLVGVVGDCVNVVLPLISLTLESFSIHAFYLMQLIKNECNNQGLGETLL